MVVRELCTGLKSPGQPIQRKLDIKRHETPTAVVARIVTFCWLQSAGQPREQGEKLPVLRGDSQMQ